MLYGFSFDDISILRREWFYPDHYCLLCSYGLFSVNIYYILAGPCILILIYHHNYCQSDTEIVFRCSDTPAALYFCFVNVLFPLTANSFEGFFLGKQGKPRFCFHSIISSNNASLGDLFLPMPCVNLLCVSLVMNKGPAQSSCCLERGIIRLRVSKERHVTHT